MAPRIRSGPGYCPVCDRQTTDLLEHVRQRHKTHRFHPNDFANTGLVVCPCGRVAASQKGLNSHQARSGCTGSQARPTRDGRSRSPSTPQVDPQAHCEGGRVDLGSTSTSASDDHADVVLGLTPPVSQESPLRRLRPHALRGRIESPEAAAEDSEWVREESSEEIETDEYEDAGADSSSDERATDSDGGLDEFFAELEPGLDGCSQATPIARGPRPFVPAPPPAGTPGVFMEGRNIFFPPRTCGPPVLPPPPVGTFFGYYSMEEAFKALARLPATYRPLPPAVASAFRHTAERLAQDFSAHPNDRAMFNFLCMPKVCLGAGVDSTHRLAAYPDVAFPDLPDFTRRDNRKAPSVQHQVELGRLGNASRILDGTGPVAGQTQEVLESLKDKHPDGESNPFGNNVGPQFFNAAPTTEEIVKAFDSFRNDTAPGVSGWTVPLLKTAMRSEPVKAMLTTLVTMLLAGTAPGRSFLCTSRLIALDKPDGGVRPIAVGELVYRLCTKAILRHSFRADSLSPCQFGVGTRGGVEPLIRAVQRAMDGTTGSDDFTHVTSLDFKNAFNSLCRREMAASVKKYAPGLWKTAKWAYNEPSDLVFGGIEGEPEVISSSQGVRQGDPLGPLLFSVGIRPMLDRLSASLGHDAVTLAYLDDVYILSKSEDTLQEVFDFFGGPDVSLQLNANKTSVVSLEEVKASGLGILGSCVGSTEARRNFMEAKVAELEVKMGKLASLPHQHSLLLLRQCLQQELRHLQRCLLTDDLTDVWRRLDRAIWDTANLLRGAHEADVDERHRRITDTLYSLPVRLGGLGLQSYQVCAPLAYSAANDVADRLLEPLLGPAPTPPQLSDDSNPDSIIRQGVRCNKEFEAIRKALFQDLTDQQIKTVLESGSGLGKKWLSIVPFYSSLRLSDFEISAGLHVKTLLPGPGVVCRQCGVRTVEVGHAEVCVHRQRWSTARHEQVKRAIASALSKIPGVAVVVEPLIEGTARRNDIRITGSQASGVARHEYDVTVVSLSTRDSVNTRIPPTSLSDDPAERCHALIDKFLDSKAEDKIRRLPRNGIPFTPLVFTVGGMMDKGTVAILQLWKETMPAATFATLCQQLSLILLKARARSFVL
jgi:hypothetical protein